MDKINYNNNESKDYSYSDTDYSKEYISIKEFKENGYLQEINRLFLHPVGMALEIGVDGDDYQILGIIDARKSGISFGLEDCSDKDRHLKFEDNARKVLLEKTNQVSLRGIEGVEQHKTICYE